MNEKEIIELYILLEKNGIKIWTDGGWGVDALLGQQTRPHEDLDRAIQELKGRFFFRHIISHYDIINI